MKPIQRTLVALAAVLCTAGAQADTLFTLGATGALVTPGSLDTTFAAGAGSGLLSLQVQGYNSLDGDNYYIDIFRVRVNGAEVFSGTWNLGGGGADRVLSNPNGAIFAHVGSIVDLSIPVTFMAGANTVNFAYESPNFFEGSNRAGAQGIGDEGWGLNAVSISGNAVAAVPEPGTYALMLAGLGLIGVVKRHRAAAR